MCKKRMLSKKCVYKSYVYLIYSYKEDLVLNNLQWLMCHKTKPNKTILSIARQGDDPFRAFLKATVKDKTLP